MYKKKILYKEPNLNSQDLEIAELINGAYASNLSRFSEIYTNGRYKNDRVNPDMLNLFEQLGINLNCKSTNLSLCYLPEFDESGKDDYIILTHTPPIKELKFKGAYDFYNGDFYGSKRVENFPYGFIVGADNFCVSGFNNEGFAIGANADESIVYKGTNINKHTYKYEDFSRENDPNAFFVVVLDALCRYKTTLKYSKAKYPLYKMSFLKYSLFLINYDLWNSKLAFYKNGVILYDLNFSSGENLSFFRTKRYDLAYTKKELFLFDKYSLKLITLKFDKDFNKLTFNPVLKSICINKNDIFSVYRFAKGEFKLLFNEVKFNEAIAPFVVAWAGNLRYDYIIRDAYSNSRIKSYIGDSYNRGHYLKMWGEYEADFNVGLWEQAFDLGIGSDFDFHICDTDDGDLGTNGFLKNRNKVLNFEPKVDLNAVSYARNYKGVKSIIFYSLDFDNNFGKLLLYTY